MDVWWMISCLLLGMLVIRFVVVLVNLISPVLLSVNVRFISKVAAPRVSILIPARNEAENLPFLLSDIKNSDYPNLEVVVCNDHSTDTTLEVLNSHAVGWPVMSSFTSQPLPEGWMGKNFACHQLAKRASGDWLLFLDADVRLNKDAITKAVDYALRKRVSLLSIFPQQIMKTRGERQTVPVMNWILLSMLPLVAVRLSWFTSLSAANGQFMLFEAAAYRRHQWHRQVWNKNVDDILIARAMKRQKLSIVVLTGNKDVMCRMYSTKEEAIQGFARNMHHFFGGHRFWMLLFVAIAWIRLPFFAVAGQWWFLVVSVLIILVMKIGVALISRQPVRNSLLMHFAHLWSMSGMVIANLRNRRHMKWKGRIYRTA